MHTNSIAFWSAINKIRHVSTADAETMRAFSEDPVTFLRARELDPEIDLGAQGTTRLSDVLQHASLREREAMLQALYSLAGVPSALKNDPLLQPASRTRIQAVVSPDPELILVAANANAFINANAVENVNANANANANQLTNANANQYTNANANNNSNGSGIGGMGDSEGSLHASNISLARNGFSVETGPDYSATAVAGAFHNLGLNPSRQRALIKRALLDAPGGFGDSIEDGDTRSVTYSYRDVAFSVTASARGNRLIVDAINLA